MVHLALHSPIAFLHQLHHHHPSQQLQKTLRCLFAILHSVYCINALKTKKPIHLQFAIKQPMSQTAGIVSIFGLAMFWPQGLIPHRDSLDT